MIGIYIILESSPSSATSTWTTPPTMRSSRISSGVLKKLKMEFWFGVFWAKSLWAFEVLWSLILQPFLIGDRLFALGGGGRERRLQSSTSLNSFTDFVRGEIPLSTPHPTDAIPGNDQPCITLTHEHVDTVVNIPPRFCGLQATST